MRLGVDLLKVAQDEADVIKAAQMKRDQRVCVCGHPVARHHDYAGLVSCKPTRMECPCGQVVPVVEVSDIRVFLRKTLGWGGKHALARGLASIEANEKKTWAWLDGYPTCMRCVALSREPDGEEIIPVSVKSSGRISEEPEKVNALLCKRCVEELM